MKYVLIKYQLWKRNCQTSVLSFMNVSTTKVASFSRSMFCLKIWLNLERKCEKQSSLATSGNDYHPNQYLTQQNWKHEVLHEALGTCLFSESKQIHSCCPLSEDDQAKQGYGKKKTHQRTDNTIRPVHEPKEGQVKISESTKGTYFHFVLDSLYTRNSWHFFIQNILQLWEKSI